MPRPKPAHYKSLVLSYYARPVRPKPVAPTKSRGTVVITKAFDDGKPAYRPAPDEYIEYDIVSRQPAARAMEAEVPFVEYDVSGREPALAQPASLSDEGAYIEPFMDSLRPSAPMPAPAPTRQAPCNCGCKGQDETPAAEAQPPADTVRPVPSPAPPATGGPASFPEGPVPSAAQSRAAGDDTEHDFMADIKSILSGEKLYDPTSKSLTSKEEAPPAARSKPKAPPPDEGAPFKESEHAIFDKIAQSMRYSNAYDLGSIALEQRFEEFDRMESAPPPPPPAAPPVTYVPASPAPPVAAAVPAQPAVPVTRVKPAAFAQDLASAKDFLSDLDLIFAQTSGGFAPPIDAVTGAAPLAPTALQAGDLLLFQRSLPGNDPAAVLSSEAALFAGDGKVLRASTAGLAEESLSRLLEDSTLTAAYRHTQASEENTGRLVA
ncbi:MAG TPA: hypothetical protein VHK69_02755, partial [Chitinophagaceae bacterium]|nr:hypothetical protein [Chitinophagaceae bacterium]